MQIQVLSVVVGLVLPILVGVVTTRVTHPGVKAALLAALSAATGLLSEYLAHPGGFDWRAAGMSALVAFVVAVATHFGLWKPVGLSGWVQDNVGVTGSGAKR